MPTTINGIGTHYYGKKNLKTREGVCEQCGQEATLSSYDTRLFVVFVFIPVLPLGKKRIIDACSRCSRHGAVPLDTYHEMRTSTLEELAAAHRADVRDAAGAVRYNAALLEFGEEENGRRHLVELLRIFDSDASVLYYGAVVAEREGRRDEATRLFARAYELDPDDPAIRHAKIIQSIEDGDLATARGLVEKSTPEERDPSALFLLARSYQDRSEHQNALDIFRLLLSDVPELAQNKDVRQAIAASETTIASGGQSLLPPRGRPWGQIGGWAAATTILIAFAVATEWYARNHFPLHIVNAFPGELILTLDGGEELVFEGAGRREVEIPEGAHRAEVVSPFHETIDFEIRRSFSDRYFGDLVGVLNPGGLALLLWEETLYSEHPVDSYEPELRADGGERFRLYRDIDYPFKEFPDELTLDSSSDQVTKRRLSVAELDPPMAFIYFLGDGEATDALDYLERWLELAPTNELLHTYSGTAISFGEGPRAAAFLKPGLTLEPVNVEWHRAYQQAAQAGAPGLDELRAEYAAHLEAAPGSADLLYLRGRIEIDPRRAMAFYTDALAEEPGHRRALQASGYQHLSSGHFDDAVESFAAAVEHHPEILETTDLYEEALHAAGRFDLLEPRFDDLPTTDPMEIAWDRAQKLAELWIARGETGRVDAWIAEVEAIEAAQPAEEAGATAAWLRAVRNYAVADWQALAEDPEMASLFIADTDFWLAVETGDPRELDPESFDALSRLILSLSLSRAGETERAVEMRRSAIAELVDVDEAYRTYQQLADGEMAITAESLERLIILPADKALLLVALAEERPEHRRLLHDTARHLNYKLAFPHHLLASFHG